jgi:hypothetical protein
MYTTYFNIQQFCILSRKNKQLLPLNTTNQLVFIMETCCVFFEVGTECVGIIYVSFF